MTSGSKVKILLTFGGGGGGGGNHWEELYSFISYTEQGPSIISCLEVEYIGPDLKATYHYC